MSVAELTLRHSHALPSQPDIGRMVSVDSDDLDRAKEWKKMQNIRVIARFRPANKVERKEEREKKLKDATKLKIKGNKVTMAMVAESGKKQKKYESELDHIFKQDTKQKAVFKVVGEPLINAALGGFNATLFAYGQTGSGTHTLSLQSLSVFMFSNVCRKNLFHVRGP